MIINRSGEAFMVRKFFVGLFAILLVSLNTFVASSFAANPVTGWKINRDLKFHLVYLPQTQAANVSGQLNPALRNIPAYEPDITNIGYKDILGLGFPLPTRSAPERLKLYLKLYEWPKSLDHDISARKVLDAFLLRNIPGGSDLYDYVQARSQVRIKYATIDSSDKRFSQAQPLAAAVPKTQDDFDSSVPFSSVYVLPAKSTRAGTESEKAAASATGVLAVHRAIIDLYSRILIRLGEETAGDKVFFAEQRRCSDKPEELCGLRVFEVQKKPFVFPNYKDLPMPQDPKKVFLSGLLLVKMTDYAAKNPADRSRLTALVPGSADFASSFIPIWSHLLEVGSVFDLRSLKN